MNKNLPVGIQSFQDLRETNYIYVDKTQYLYKMITTGKPYFLSRPRRFGKSLTISTLDAIFRAKKHLFEGLFIYNSDYDWQECPVIRIDMSKPGKGEELGVIKEKVSEQLLSIVEEYDLGIVDYIDPSDLLDKIFNEFGKQGKKAAVLVDEYDKPILDNITKDNIEEIRDFLGSFYSIIKSQDDNVKFILLTGVSKFSKVSVFSGLNSLMDISISDDYSAICGYTQDELEQCFAPYIGDLALHQGVAKAELLEKIKYWYNGFKFSDCGKKVYNPFSTLLLLRHRKFDFYWFETATPTFLIKLLLKNIIELPSNNEEFLARSDSFGTFEVERLEVLPLLYQSGYLTIRSYDPEDRFYVLDYPNFEVKEGFLSNLLLLASDVNRNEGSLGINKLRDAIIGDDLELFFSTLRIFFANIPYEIQLNNEKYYQSIFYAILQLLGFYVEVESKTNRGRMDAVITTKSHIYIFEFKLNGTKEEALKQIIDKEYALKYKGDKRKIKLVGAAFDQKTRVIEEGDWVVEELD